MGAFTVGLMGIDPSEKFGTISTISRLPRREAWASIENVPYHGLILSLRHDGIDRSTLTNRSDRPLTWIVRFPGVSGRLFHDTGRIKTRKGRDEAGNDFLWGRVVVPPGTEMSVNREMFD